MKVYLSPKVVDDPVAESKLHDFVQIHLQLSVDIWLFNTGANK